GARFSRAGDSKWGRRAEHGVDGLTRAPRELLGRVRARQFGASRRLAPGLLLVGEDGEGCGDKLLDRRPQRTDTVVADDVDAPTGGVQERDGPRAHGLDGDDAEVLLFARQPRRVEPEPGRQPE